jgi:SAM-dependent methyltransferase
MASRAHYAQGTFASTGLGAASADGAVSFDALQYAPDKRAAFAEAARVLRPGGRFVFACFELEPERVRGLPVLGEDPVADYAPLLEDTGFEVAVYRESEAWNERVTRTYEAVTAARDALLAEMGEAATLALLGEVMLTLQVQPYRRRVLVSARR